MTDLQAVHQCILACVRAKDRRGRWRPHTACFNALEQAGASPEIALATAQAAERFGSWLHDRAEWAQARAAA